MRTKKCSCHFSLKGRKLPTDDDWMVIVVYGVHNHPNVEHLEVHSYSRRLSKEELNVSIDMSKSLGKPRNNLHTLKQRDVNNTTIMKGIYNAELTTTAKFELIAKKSQESDQLGKI